LAIIRDVEFGAQEGGNKASSFAIADSASKPQGRELVYAAHVSLDRTAMTVDGRDVPLSPGMAVTVEIKTGAQRVITYLMSSLLRFGTTARMSAELRFRCNSPATSPCNSAAIPSSGIRRQAFGITGGCGLGKAADSAV
jgi:hypothetical protein